MLRTFTKYGFLLLLVSAAYCGDAAGGGACRTFAQTAVTVRIVGDRPVSSVTVSHNLKADCQALSEDVDAGLARVYVCFEQGPDAGGDYTVEVTSGDETWSRTVQLAGEGCHISGPAVTVEIDLTAHTT